MFELDEIVDVCFWTRMVEALMLSTEMWSWKVKDGNLRWKKEKKDGIKSENGGEKGIPDPGLEPGSHGWKPCILTT